MSTFDIVQDAPGLLRSEAVNITLMFSRTGPDSGRVSWAIPTPAAGCSATTQAYCGILITLDTTPASIDKIPVNGQVYTADATGSTNLFAGDKISSSFVVGGFYNDRTTTFFDITGLMPNTPYYISGYPMDCQYRYFAQGIHAYSLDYTNRGTDGTNGSQIIVLNSSGPMGQKLTDYTGLAPTVSYNFIMQLGLTPSPNRVLDSTECLLKAPTYTITINGTDAQTYQDLINAINIQLSKLQNGAQGPLPPNTGGYFWNAAQQSLFVWDGSQHVQVPVIIDTIAPNIVNLGTYWLNTTTNILSMWDGSIWTPIIVISFATDPTMPIADKTYWFDGTFGYIWNGTTWCKVITYLQPTDPSLAITPLQGSYWFDTINKILYKWDNVLELWIVTIAIQFDLDPNSLPTNTYWFDQSNNTLYAFNIPSIGWNEQINVAITETAPSTPAPGKFWYNPTTSQLFQRDNTNIVWTPLDVLVFPVDPTQRNVCDLWWDLTTNYLKVWDSINSVWKIISTFYQQGADPTIPPVISNGTVWYNTDTNTFYTWVNNCFVITPYISWPTDPTISITDGTVWYDITNNSWYVRQLSVWVLISPISSTQDLNALTMGTFWFNPTVQALQQWNGISWVTVGYSSTPLTPSKGALWFNSTISTLEMWDGTQWVSATPLATVQMDCNGNLLFTDTTIGSLSFVGLTDGTLFKSLKVPFTIHDPNPGVDGASDIPSYDELGIGTDGSGAFRNQMENEIRMELGYPIVDAELTTDQMNYAIDRALQEFRQKASIAYRRGFFFMQLLSEQQNYFLTNKISGMNKIVDILGIYRLTSAFLSSAHGAGVYGQIVLQHLYNMGTFDLLSYHIMGEYTKLMEILFAARVTFTWNEQSRELFIHHRFPFKERMVAIEATVERTEQDILSDRYVRPWIRRYAAAICRLMLAEIRGKYASLPGAGGNTTLNAETLRQAAASEIELLLAELENYIADRPEEWGIGQTFTFG